MPEKTYICIDLKSFYASVECIDRGLDPFTAKLVVADKSRTKKTICLAITPAMKALGIPNRCRLFQIPDNIEYEIAPPRMKHYMEVSANIYAIYLRYISPADIHVYSIDECFIDATPYLTLYKTDARTFAKTLMAAVRAETGIPSSVGIGTNLFLAKVALDITAKHSPESIGFLDEEAFKEHIWFHKPITDVWNIGHGIARRLAKYGVHDLAGVAAMEPATLYREFGKNAEYLLDHAWGQETCTIAEIKAYKPEGHSLSSGQVLPCDYSFEDARIVMKEMVDAAVLELVEQGLVAERISLMIGYSKNASGGSTDIKTTSWTNGSWANGDVGGIPSSQLNTKNTHPYTDARTWRSGIEHTGGTRKLERRTNSAKLLMERFCILYDETTKRTTPIKRLSIGLCDLLPEEHATHTLFDDIEAEEQEHKLQHALIDVREKFGKNAMLKGMSLMEKATAQERNKQVGGHHE